MTQSPSPNSDSGSDSGNSSGTGSRDESPLSEVARRYGSVLHEMAQAQNDIERAERDMTELENCLNQSKELAEVTRSPLIAPKDKQAVFGAIMEKMDLCALTANFVHTIIANGRVSALPDIIAAFHAKAQEASGAVGAKITAARQLSQEQKNELTDAIEKTLGKKLLPRFAVDSSLLGGLIVKIGSRQIDTCLKTKLSSMKLKLKEVG